jgi:hypothetical protein
MGVDEPKRKEYLVLETDWSLTNNTVINIGTLEYPDRFKVIELRYNKIHIISEGNPSPCNNNLCSYKSEWILERTE